MDRAGSERYKKQQEISGTSKSQIEHVCDDEEGYARTAKRPGNRADNRAKLKRKHYYIIMSLEMHVRHVPFRQWV